MAPKPKKTAAEKKAEAAVTAAAEKAAKDSAKAVAATAKPHVYRTDLGESLP